jgi:hypothetical protein
MIGSAARCHINTASIAIATAMPRTTTAGESDSIAGDGRRP